MVGDSIAENVTKNIFRGSPEKTFIDKLLAKEEVAKIRDFLRKENLTRSDIREILNLMAGAESKLYNFSDWDRYVVLKFFVWLREFVAILELLYDYEEKTKDENLDEETKILFKNSKKLMMHSLTSMIDLYLNIARTSLSQGGSAFFEAFKQRFEIDYKNAPGFQTPIAPQQQQQQIFKPRRGGRL